MRNQVTINVPDDARQVRVWLALPQEERAQEVRDLRIEAPYPYRVERDSEGSRVLYLEVDQPRERSFTVREAFVVTRSEVRSGVDAVRARPLTAEDRALYAKGYADGVHEEGFSPLRELMENFAKAGGSIYVCSPCFKRRKLDENNLRSGRAAPAPAAAAPLRLASVPVTIPASLPPPAPAPAIPPLAVMGIGSWPRPRWMVQAIHDRIEGRLGAADFEATAEDAARLAVQAQLRAGVDVVTDGEQRRDNYASFVGGLLDNCALIPLTDLLPLVDDPKAFEEEMCALDVPAAEVRHPAVFGPPIAASGPSPTARWPPPEWPRPSSAPSRGRPRLRAPGPPARAG